MATPEALAQQFEASNAAFIAEVEGCSDEQWHATAPAEHWSVAATAMHVARAHLAQANLVQGIAGQTPVPSFTLAALDQWNAETTAQFAGVSKADVLAELRANGTAADAIVRDIAPDNLGKTAFLAGQTISAETMANNLIQHSNEHRASIHQAG